MISIVLFFFIRVDSPFLRLGIRLLMIPVIAGISYEVLRAMGKYDNWFTRAISAPGLWFQSLTTREPDKDMAEVAIKAVEAVFDWKEYLKENFGYVPSGDEEGWLDDDDEEMDTETMEALMSEVETDSSEIMAEMKLADEYNAEVAEETEDTEEASADANDADE